MNVKDGNDHGENHARLVLRLSVELFAEAHDVHARRTECGTDGGSGVSRARGELQLNFFYYFFCHFSSLFL